MKCEKCTIEFDQSVNEPMVLFFCAHTLCRKCVNIQIGTYSKCPFCNIKFKHVQINKYISERATKSVFDTMKNDLLETKSPD